MDLYVATNGNDAWSGAHPRPLKQKGDGPLATLAGAVKRLRALYETWAATHQPTPWGGSGQDDESAKGGNASPETRVAKPGRKNPANVR